MSSRAKKSFMDSGHSSSEVPRASFSNKNTVCPPARRLGQASRRPFYVFLFSGPSLDVSKVRRTLFNFICPHRPQSLAGSHAGSPVS
jgi:hypothetical protein